MENFEFSQKILTSEPLTCLARAHMAFSVLELIFFYQVSPFNGEDTTVTEIDSWLRERTIFLKIVKMRTFQQFRFVVKGYNYTDDFNIAAFHVVIDL